MKISKKFIVATGLTLLFILNGCGNTEDNNPNKALDNNNAAQAKAMSISIIHVNDSHSHLEGDTYSLYFNGNKVKTQLGGYPRMVTKIKELQSANKNTLTLNAGDTFQGTLYYTLFKGKADSDMLNMISWDALELGNHEFDDGDNALATFLGNLTSAKILAANIEPQTGNVLAGKWSPYIIKDYNGSKVGVIGIDTKQKTEVSSNPSKEITFLDEVTTAQKYIDELKAKGINKIVLLTHQGYEKDKTFASKLSGIDVVIGGDSHTLLGDHSAAGLTTKEGYNYPSITKNKDGETVCIGQAWQYTYAVGDMKVNFDENGVVTSCSGNAILLLGDKFTINSQDANTTAKSEILSIINSHANLEIVAKDTATDATLKTYTDQVAAQKNTVIGESAQFLGHNRIPGDKLDGKSNLALGSDIAPIVAKSFYDLSNRADACIQNAGGVRIAVDEGNVTMNTAYTLLPFSNTLFEIEMYGSEIKQVLEDAMSNYLDNGGSTGSFPYAYGLRYDVNEKAAKNNRITNLEIKDRTAGTWSAISNDKMYVVVTNNYTAAGHDGYVTFKTVQDSRGAGVDTYLDYAMSFVKYMQKLTKEGKKLEKLPASDHCIKSFNAGV